MLIPAPYYPAFDNDLQVVARVFTLHASGGCSACILPVALHASFNHTTLQVPGLRASGSCMGRACKQQQHHALRRIVACSSSGWVVPAAHAGLMTLPLLTGTLQAKCRVHPLPFYLTEPGTSGSGDGSGGSIRQQLDAAAAASAARGVPVRSLLITNPNNPLGTLYEEDTLLEMLRWCLDNKVHYIRQATLYADGRGIAVALWAWRRARRRRPADGAPCMRLFAGRPLKRLRPPLFLCSSLQRRDLRSVCVQAGQLRFGHHPGAKPGGRQRRRRRQQWRQWHRVQPARGGHLCAPSLWWVCHGWSCRGRAVHACCCWSPACDVPVACLPPHPASTPA